MSNEALKTRLEVLHQELEKAHRLSPEDRDMIGNLMADMVLIAQGEGQSDPVNVTHDKGHYVALLEKLEIKASEFDVDHPRLAGVLRQLLDSLNKMGM